MPSPGATTIAATICEKTYIVEGNHATVFNKQGTFVQSLAKAMDSGWTSATPTTTTTMVASFEAEFSERLKGQGKQMIMCIAQAIDAETAAWAASWDSLTMIHTYAPNVGSIVITTQGCAPLWSQGAIAITEVVAKAFVDHFEQEVG